MSLTAPSIPSSLNESPRISVVITAHNEGDELVKTIGSIRTTTPEIVEVIVVDDGSTDRSCEPVASIDQVRVITHKERIGVAFSRNEATRVACGNVIAYFDGHQRVEGDALRRCAETALSNRAIVTPDICNFDDEIRLHGAYFTQCSKRNYFAAEWKLRPARNPVSRISSLRAPTYVIPKATYDIVGWSPLLRGWGGSEAAVSLKAFFADVPILHLCGPVIRHQFKPKFHYQVGWDEVWRNQAIIARICFDDSSWYRYWLPDVFHNHLNPSVLAELESESMQNERERFASHRIRCDEEYWSRLIFHKLPTSLK